MPEPRYRRRHRLPAFLTAVTMILWATLFAPGTPTRAADDKLLQRVKGTVQFQNPNAAATTIVGKQLIGDDAAAITQAKSAATLTLPDSSIVALGENTNISVGAFNQVTATAPGSLTVKVTGGTVRFDVHRVNGQAADYHFSTPTTQIAVRGTVGAFSLAPNGNLTIACFACGPDSVLVSVIGNAQAIPLLTGQLLSISAAGVVVTGAITAGALASFSAAGVSTSAASGAAAATAGVAGGAAAAGSAAAVTTAAVAAGAVGAAAAVSSASTSSNASPLPGLGGNTPAPTGTGAGTINLTGLRPTPSPSPVARPTTPPQAPTLGPPGRH